MYKFLQTLFGGRTLTPQVMDTVVVQRGPNVGAIVPSLGGLFNTPASLERLSTLQSPTPPPCQSVGDDEVRALISEDMEIDGDMTIHSGIKIDGYVNGNVTVLGGALIVSACGRVRGNIIALKAYVDGSIEGSLDARGALIGPNARIRGKVNYNNLHWQQGGMIDGSVTRVDVDGEGPEPSTLAGTERAIRKDRAERIVRTEPHRAHSTAAPKPTAVVQPIVRAPPEVRDVASRDDVMAAG